MLLRIEPTSRHAVRVVGERLKTFGLDERGLQDVLFRSLDRLLPDEELLLVSQSRRWQEEPDLLALDEHGQLYIFEIKVWESHPESLLQALSALRGSVRAGGDQQEKWADSSIRKLGESWAKASCSPAATRRSTRAGSRFVPVANLELNGNMELAPHSLLPPSGPEHAPSAG
jgi:hypothetical protein